MADSTGNIAMLLRFSSLYICIGDIAWSLGKRGGKCQMSPNYGQTYVMLYVNDTIPTCFGLDRDKKRPPVTDPSIHAIK